MLIYAEDQSILDNTEVQILDTEEYDEEEVN